MYTTHDLYESGHSLLSDYILSFTYPWEALKGIKDAIIELGKTLGGEYRLIGENVWVHESAVV